jgi:hypothetical protein
MFPENIETTMFVRKVTTLLKPNSISTLSVLMEHDVIPLLREQVGFQDELTFFAPNEDRVTGISLWDKASDAEAYRQAAFGIVLEKLAPVIEGDPRVDTYEVVNSTFRQVTPVPAVPSAV